MLNEKDHLLLSKLRVQRAFCFVFAVVALFLSMSEMIIFNPPVRDSGEVIIPHLFSLNEVPSPMLYICMVTLLICLFLIIKTSKTIDGLLKTQADRPLKR